MPPKTSKPAPPAALAPEVDETTDSASADYGHIDDFVASLSDEEKMYLMTKLEEESAPENSDDKEYDEAVGLRAPAAPINDEGEMD